MSATVQDRTDKLGPLVVIEEPTFVVASDSTLVIDARETKPVGFTVDRPNARAGDGKLETVRVTEWGWAGLVALPSLFPGDVGYRPSTTSKKDKYTFVVDEHLAEWTGTSFEGSPYLYHLRRTENGAVPETLRWTAHDRELAQVRSEHAMATPVRPASGTGSCRSRCRAR